jgi:small redox-active disulfide protein 2
MHTAFLGSRRQEEIWQVGKLSRSSGMKRIQILGTGLSNCDVLMEHAREAAHHAGVLCEIERVVDIERIMRFHVPITPALVVDGKVRVAGRVPSAREIELLLK